MNEAWISVEKSHACLIVVDLSLFCIWGLFYWHGPTLIQHIVGDEITYPFPKFNSAAVEFW